MKREARWQGGPTGDGLPASWRPGWSAHQQIIWRADRLQSPSFDPLSPASRRLHVILPW